MPGRGERGGGEGEQVVDGIPRLGVARHGDVDERPVPVDPDDVVTPAGQGGRRPADPAAGVEHRRPARHERSMKRASPSRSSPAAASRANRSA